MVDVKRSKDMVAKEKAAIEEMRQSIHKERLSMQIDDSFNEDLRRLSEEKQMVQQQAEHWLHCRQHNAPMFKLQPALLAESKPKHFLSITFILSKPVY